MPLASVAFFTAPLSRLQGRQVALLKMQRQAQQQLDAAQQEGGGAVVREVWSSEDEATGDGPPPPTAAAAAAWARKAPQVRLQEMPDGAAE